MKIIKNSPNEILIRDSNIFGFFIGVSFVLVGAGSYLNMISIPNTPNLLEILFVIIGLFIISLRTITTIHLDKAKNKGVIKWSKIFSKETRELELNKISALETYPTYLYSRMARSGSSVFFALTFVLNDGEKTPIFKPHYGKSLNETKKIGTQIAQFLNVPFEERSLPTIKETLSTIKDAVKETIQNEAGER